MCSCRVMPDRETPRPSLSPWPSIPALPSAQIRSRLPTRRVPAIRITSALQSPLLPRPRWTPRHPLPISRSRRSSRDSPSRTQPSPGSTRPASLPSRTELAHQVPRRNPASRLMTVLHGRQARLLQSTMTSSSRMHRGPKSRSLLVPAPCRPAVKNQHLPPASATRQTHVMIASKYTPMRQAPAVRPRTRGSVQGRQFGSDQTLYATMLPRPQHRSPSPARKSPSRRPVPVSLLPTWCSFWPGVLYRD